MRGGVDPIEVIEAGYRLDGTDIEWLTAIAEAARPLVDGGHGIVVYAFDVRQPPRLWWRENAVLLGADPSLPERMVALKEALPSENTGVHSDPNVGIAASTAANHLSSAMRKLRARSRAQLVSTIARLAPAAKTHE